MKWFELRRYSLFIYLFIYFFFCTVDSFNIYLLQKKIISLDNAKKKNPNIYSEARDTPLN